MAEIRVMNADGTGARRVVGNLSRPDTSPAWSPDGRRLVFIRNTGTTSVLGIVNADGTNARLLKRAHSVYGSPSWSPTSNLIVYSDSGTALMAIAPNGTGKHPVLKRECPTGDGYTPKCTSFGDVAFSPTDRASRWRAATATPTQKRGSGCARPRHRPDARHRRPGGHPSGPATDARSCSRAPAALLRPKVQVR